ncbi:hypothetical protein Zmor_011435 [Zophobas morio]|uniref:Integrase zinc-binding domain-containing protein n=1 Tax=Zophobas morio TaxID=2755281 RepID=A0AA38ILX6_9CUCU|nr:hypothetical protein Zmor_011435 [Zophobas morio]
MRTLCREDCVRAANPATRSSGVKRRSTVGGQQDTEDKEWNTAQLRKDQEEHVDIGPLLRWKADGAERPAWLEISDGSPSFKVLWGQWDSLRVEIGLVKRARESPDGKHTTMQLVVLATRTKEVLRKMHDGGSGVHFGINKTLYKVRERFYWVRCREEVESWCKKCTTCAAVKGPRTRARGPMQQYNVGSPFERIAVDITDNRGRE